jgi:hypothetical protein
MPRTSEVDDNYLDQAVTTFANRSPGITCSQPKLVTSSATSHRREPGRLPERMATVGALGTAATGATAALLSRSTAHHQVRTEVLKVLRESRRTTYASYAKTIDHYLDKLATTLIPLED